MEMRKKIVMTNNREIYEKLNMLNFSPEVLLKDVNKMQVDRIIKNVNKESLILHAEMIGNYILVKRIGPINFSIYLR